MKRKKGLVTITWIWIVFAITTGFSSPSPQSALLINNDQDELRPQGTDREPVPHRYAAGQVIIKLKDDTFLSQIRNDLPVHSAEAVFRHLSQLSDGSKPRALERGLDRVYVITFDTTVSVESILEKYKNDPEVEYIQPNYIYEPDLVPNDPMYSQQYAHQLTQAESAWNISTGIGDIVAAVIGTGVDIDHADLAANIWVNPGEVAGNGVDDDGNGFIDDVNGWNFYNGNNNPRPDGSSHETMVAGIIGAVGNNGTGVCGVNWGCSIMPLRVAYTSADVAEAIEYARANEANIINMSFGNYTKTKYGDGLVKEMLDDAYEDGLLLVATAGNDKRDMKRYPAALYNVIASAATDQNDRRALWSSGYTGTNFGSWVDIAAPGSTILSTTPGGSYASGNGTSFSAPYIAGLGALLFSHDPNLTNIEARAILENTTDAVQPEPDFFNIGGRVNAGHALSAWSSDCPLGEIADPEHKEMVSINTQQVPLSFLAHGDFYQVDYSAFGRDQWTPIDQGDPGADTGEDGLVHLSFANPGLGTYILRLTVTKQGNTHVDTKLFGIGGIYQENWPIDTAGNQYIGASAVCMDIDEDGKNEIIQATQANYIYIWNEDGTHLPGWPQHVGNVPSNSTCAVGDVDGDGDYEVVATTYSTGTVYVWHWQNGELLSGDWPKSLGYMVRANPLLADLDGDGDAEIIVAHTGSGVNAFQHDGSYVWSTAVSNIQAPMAAADLDGDGDIEIVVSGYQDTCVVDHQGNIVQQWSGGTHKPPVIADIDQDGELEIIGFSNSSTLRALRLSGELLWQSSMGSFGPYGAISAGDLDDDGYPEIFVVEYSGTKLDNTVYGCDHEGNPLTALGFPKKTFGKMMQNAPAIGDINGDGKKDLVVASSSGLVFAWDRNGDALETFPITAGDYGFVTTAALVDLDQDNDIEIMMGDRGGRFYVWDLQGTYNPGTIDWGMYRHDPQCSGLALRAPELNQINIPETLKKGEPLQVELTAFNPDSLPLHFFVRQMPEGATFDPQTRIFAWTPTADQVGGTYNFYFFLTDGVRQDHQPVSITVLPGGEITVISPNGGEKWKMDSIRNITWNCQGVTGNLKIYLWKDDALQGTIAKNIDPFSGSYPWTVGQYEGGTAAPGTGYTIKIKEMGVHLSDFSDAPFTICSLTVTSPNGGENWKSGSAQNITWDCREITGDLKIYLWKDGALKGTIAKNLDPAAGSYPWITGQYEGGEVSVGTGYTIKIKEMGALLSDFSDAPFNITGITVTAPNGGESWQIGSTENITWNTQGVSGNLKIFLYKDSAMVGTIVKDVNPASGSYSWQVGQYEGGTASAGTGYTIKIKEMGVTVGDFSDNPFTLSN